MKECIKCKDIKNIKSFENTGKNKRRSTCTVCRSGNNKERFYYPSEYLDKLSKINNKKLEKRISKLRERRKISKFCKKCSTKIIKRISGKFLCTKCSTENKIKRSRIRDYTEVKELSNKYVRRLLTRYSSIPIDIPQELIELKRKQLKLYRYGKKT